ncbi:putative mitochondrial 54S ribosomal protein YmL33, partial [Tothia fuscella]
MAYFRITLLRSGIGLPFKTRGVLTALGLKKRMRTVYQPITQSTAGMIMKVKELVDVEEVEERSTQKQMREARKPDPGFWVERK